MARHLISTVRTLYSIMMRDLLNHQDTEETLKTKKSVNNEKLRWGLGTTFCGYLFSQILIEI